MGNGTCEAEHPGDSNAKGLSPREAASASVTSARRLRLGAAIPQGASPCVGPRLFPAGLPHCPLQFSGVKDELDLPRGPRTLAASPLASPAEAPGGVDPETRTRPFDVRRGRDGPGKPGPRVCAGWSANKSRAVSQVQKPASNVWIGIKWFYYSTRLWTQIAPLPTHTLNKIIVIKITWGEDAGSAAGPWGRSRRASLLARSVLGVWVDGPTSGQRRATPGSLKKRRARWADPDPGSPRPPSPLPPGATSAGPGAWR